jgi:aspartyl-tRNA synthetase
MKRSHHCAQLTKADLGAAVSLSGWVDSVRDHGGIIFIDLRDRKGVTQVKFDPTGNPELSSRAAHVKPESVVRVAGRSSRAPPAPSTPPCRPGEVEVDASELEVLNASETPPFPLDDAGGDKVNEDLRLTYRYLDLRRPKMRRNLAVRHRATKAIRDYFDSRTSSRSRRRLSSRAPPRAPASTSCPRGSTRASSTRSPSRRSSSSRS